MNIKFLRGTESENNSYTGSEGTITICTTTQSIRLHDGTTKGGHHIPNLDIVNELINSKLNNKLSSVNLSIGSYVKIVGR